MAANKEAQRRQRRRELDARRSKLRVRLGSWPDDWSTLKDRLGFSLHSELAQFLINAYSCKVCSRCSGDGDGKEGISVTVASLEQLILLVHSHGQQCPLTPSLQSDPHRQEVKERLLEEFPETSVWSREAETCLTYTCEGGHTFTWHPIHTGEDNNGEKREQGSTAPSGQRKNKKRQRKGVKREEECRTRSRRRARGRLVSDRNEVDRVCLSASEGNEEEEYCSNAAQHEQEAAPQEGSDAALLDLSPKFRDVVQDAVPNSTTRERKRKGDALQTGESEESRRKTRASEKDELLHMSRRRKRKPAPKLLLPCQFDGCWKIFSSRQYLNHHMKYQHIQQKTFTCSDPSCGKSFNFKKHLKEHEKLHSDQRDYICEFCARAFRTSSNLSIHRRIHTGEKPLQCEMCGFTCRQKASLNWHMRKHNAESSYRFACEICGRRFEKRDNVTAHRSKSHPGHVTSDFTTMTTNFDLQEDAVRVKSISNAQTVINA
ncbi:zinc finger protein 692 [Silurus meridionalis]|nr:zinc finger protein 692 [Silurus meridionalis]